MDGKVVIHALMAEVHVLITPVGGRGLAGSHDLANRSHCAAKLLRLVPGAHVPKSLAVLDRHEVVQVVYVAILDG